MKAVNKLKDIKYYLFILFFLSTNSLVCAGIDDPLIVQVNGKNYSDFKGIFKNGILTLYRGTDPTWDYEQYVKFWNIPEDYQDKVISFPDTNKPYLHRNMSYDKKDPSVNLSMEWLKEYSYRIKFGKEKDFKIPVIIDAFVLSPQKIKIKGTIIAYTAGIKMHNGVIDKSFDNIESIEWMTKDWIRKNIKDASIFNHPDTCVMENAVKNSKKAHRQVAACSFLYSDKLSRLKIAKLWFEKIKNEWQIIKRLESNKLFTASPIKPPFSNTPPYNYLKIAAKEFEINIYNPGGTYKRITEPFAWPCGGGQVEEQPGWCEITYLVHKKERENKAVQQKEYECKYITYLFDKDIKGKWYISKTLDTNMKYDHRKLQIRPRNKNDGWCG